MYRHVVCESCRARLPQLPDVTSGHTPRRTARKCPTCRSSLGACARVARRNVRVDGMAAWRARLHSQPPARGDCRGCPDPVRNTIIAHIVMAHRVMADTIMAYIVMAHTVMANRVMVDTGMAYIVMASRKSARLPRIACARTYTHACTAAPAAGRAGTQAGAGHATANAGMPRMRAHGALT